MTLPPRDVSELLLEYLSVYDLLLSSSHRVAVLNGDQFCPRRLLAMPIKGHDGCHNWEGGGVGLLLHI